MSKGTEALDTAMQKHSANKNACQTANSAKDSADKAFLNSASLLQGAIEDVKAEALQLASEASGLIPVASETVDNN